MTGAYTFKKWEVPIEPGHWVDLPKGHWTRTAQPTWKGRTVFLCCPVCGQVASIPHQINAQGVAHPSVACPYTPCPMHLMPVTLEGWDLGEKPRDHSET